MNKQKTNIVRTHTLILIHEIRPKFDPRKYAQFQGQVANFVRFARKIVIASRMPRPLKAESCHSGAAGVGKTSHVQ